MTDGDEKVQEVAMNPAKLARNRELEEAILKNFSCGESRPMRGADDAEEWYEDDEADDLDVTWNWDVDSCPIGKAGNVTAASVSPLFTDNCSTNTNKRRE